MIFLNHRSESNSDQPLSRIRANTLAMVYIAVLFTIFLFQSFRFGPEIAHVASCCLEFLKNERRKTLVGNGKPGRCKFFISLSEYWNQ